MEHIRKYFPSLSALQVEQFEQLEPLYCSWNERINVISRKDIDNIYLHHVLHSLAIARFVSFNAGTRILDVGTGGGFPGIVLAIMFPDCHFHLTDSINKKITVVQAVADALQLKNVKAHHMRAEDDKNLYDFVISRAVAPVDTLVRWNKKNISKKQTNSIANGFIFLKGGNLDEELSKYPQAIRIPISNFFREDFFAEKNIIHLPWK